MTREQTIKEIETIMDTTFRGGVSLYKLGVEERDRPIVSQIGQITIKVCELRHYRAYLSVYVCDNDKCCGSASYSDLPTNVLKELLSILKKATKKS
jgi:hypothetical protein